MVLLAVSFLAALAAVAQSPTPAAPAASPAMGSILDDPLFQQEAHAGLDALYDMDFGAADEIFTRLSLRYTGHPVGPFLQALLPWWAIQIEPTDTSQDGELLADLDRVLTVCENRLDENPRDVDALFFRSSAYALRGRLHADRGRWMRAARDGQQALSDLREVAKRDPKNADLSFGLGLFDYLADVVPRQYKFLRAFTFLFPKGDRDRGLLELTRAMDSGRFVPTEAAYSLLQIQYVFEQNYVEGLHYAQWLRQRHPDNSLFELYEGRMYERLGRLAEAGRTFDEILDRHDKGQSGYTDAIAEQALYLLARVEMRSHRYDVALAQIDRLEQLGAQRGVDSEYKALGRLRRGMAFDALGRRPDAVRCYHDVLAMNGSSSIQDRARTYLKQPYRP
jgi:tetratricopeptide (TPR) repeat protein